MARPARRALIAAALILAAAIALATRVTGKQSGDSQAAYDQWVAKYAAKSLDGNILEITLVSERPNNGGFAGDLTSTHTFTVKPDGKNWRESEGAFGSRGSDGNFVAPESLARLQQLLSDLPADPHRLPPPERRVLIQTATATRVYDRANLPDSILEILRLSNSGVTAWHEIFKAQRRIEIRTGGPLLPDPNGKRLLCGLEFFAIPTYETLGELELDGYDGIAFSPDGTIAALTDAGGDTRCGCQIFGPSSWKPTRTLLESSGSLAHLHDPCFTPDGRGLVYSANDELRYFDSTTWQRVVPAPGIPPDAIQWTPSKTWRHAIMLKKPGAIWLWDAKSKSARELDNTSYLLGAAFSPDESQLALATSNKDRYSNPRLRVFNTDTGQLVHELRAGEIGCDRLSDPQWTPDGRYVFAVTKPGSFFDNQYVSLWSAKSGRHRADFDCDFGVGGVLLPPPGDQLIVSCGRSQLRLFDFAAAVRQISAFEDRLPTP